MAVEAGPVEAAHGTVDDRIMSEMRTESVMAHTPPRARRDLADLGDVAVAPSVERAVAAVRDYLGLDVAYATAFVYEQQHFRVLDADGEAFGVHEGRDHADLAELAEVNREA